MPRGPAQVVPLLRVCWAPERTCPCPVPGPRGTHAGVTAVLTCRSGSPCMGWEDQPTLRVHPLCVRCTPAEESGQEQAV